MADKPDGIENADKQAPRVRWDTSNLKSSYSNVCNVTSTREEVVLNFGVNQAWEQGNTEMLIELSNRLILSPFAAKRLSVMLSNLVDEFEKRHGVLDIEATKGKPASPQSTPDET
jgi:hypothetical protein